MRLRSNTALLVVTAVTVVTVVTVVVVASGCILDLAPPADAQLTCASTSDCPPEDVCNADVGLCVPKVRTDTTPPALEDGATIEPPSARLGVVVAIAFATTEPLARDPVVTVGDAAATLTTSTGGTNGGTSFAYAYTARGTEENDEVVTAVLVDKAGNPAQVTVGTAHFDFVAPSIGAPTATPARVAPNATSSIAFDVDEDGAVTADLDGAALTQDASSTPTQRVFTFTPAASASSSSLALHVTATDAAGNASERRAQDLVIVDADAPAVVGTPIVTVRAPAGSLLGADEVSAATLGAVIEVTFTVSEALGTAPVVSLAPVAGDVVDVPLVVDAAPTFTHQLVVDATNIVPNTYAVRIDLADAVGLTSTTTLPATSDVTIDLAAPLEPDTSSSASSGTGAVFVRKPFGVDGAATPASTVVFPAGALEPNAFVRALSAGAPPFFEIARTSAGDDGAAALELLEGGAASDRATVFVQAIDGAGNASAIVEVKNGSFTFTGAGASSVVSSGALRDVAKPAFATARDAAALNALNGVDGVVDSVTSSMRWLQGFSTKPHARGRAAVAYDSVHGVLVLFGGSTKPGLAGFVTGADCGEGGDDQCGFTWTFDGTNWSLAASSGPAPRTSPAMVYDSRRGRVLLFGGESNTDCGENDGAFCRFTWAWDGRDWNVVDDGSEVNGRPGGRSEHMMAYDALDDRVVLFGGRRGVDAASTCGAVAGSGVDDGDCGATWLFDGADDTWSLAISSNTAGVNGAPLGRTRGAMAFDETSGSTLLFGGQAFSNSDCGEGDTNMCGATWAFAVDAQGTPSWSELVPGNLADPTKPRARFANALVHDDSVSGGGGGGAGGLLLLEGTSFSGCGEGQGSSCTKTWRFDAATNTWIDEGPAPPSRQFAAAAFDRASGAPVLLGGFVDGGNCGEFQTGLCSFVWRRESGSWIARGLASVPAVAVDDAVITYDPLRGQPLIVVTKDGLAGRAFHLTGDGFIDDGATGLPGEFGLGAVAFDLNRNIAQFFGGASQVSLPTPPFSVFRANATLTEQSSPGSSTWAVPATSGAAPRFNTAMAFIPGFGTVLYGGERAANDGACTVGRFCHLLQVYDAGTRTWLFVVAGTPRAGHGMAFDEARGELVAFGGHFQPPAPTAVDALQTGTEVFTTSTLTWSTITDVGPPGAVNPGMAFDDNLGDVILVEGASDLSGSALEQGTWRWDGVEWIDLGIVSPSPRRQARMVFDKTTKRMVLFGGDVGVGSSQVKDTWFLDDAIDARAGFVAEFPLGALGLPTNASSSSVSAIDARWVGGASRSSAPPSPSIVADGAELDVWHDGRLESVATSSASAASPAALTTSISDAATLAALADAGDGLLRFALRSSSANGNGSATVSSDYVEITVRYRRP